MAFIDPWPIATGRFRKAFPLFLSRSRAGTRAHKRSFLCFYYLYSNILRERDLTHGAERRLAVAGFGRAHAEYDGRHRSRGSRRGDG